MASGKLRKKYRITSEDLVATNLRIDKETYNWFKDKYGVFWSSTARKVLRSFMIAEKTYGNDREIFR